MVDAELQKIFDQILAKGDSGTDAEIEQAERRRQERRRLDICMESLPPALRDVRRLRLIKPYLWQEEIQAALQFRAGLKFAGIKLSGDVGSGKTFLAVAYLWERFYLHGEVFTFAPAASIANRELDRSDVAGTVILDDLGAERVDNYGRDRVMEFIYWLSDYRRPVVITTNLEIGAIAERYTLKIASRIAGILGRKDNSFILHGEDIRRMEIAKNA